MISTKGESSEHVTRLKTTKQICIFFGGGGVLALYYYFYLLTLCIHLVQKRSLSRPKSRERDVELAMFVVLEFELVTKFNLLENSTSKEKKLYQVHSSHSKIHICMHTCVCMRERNESRGKRVNMEMKVSVSEINTLDIFLHRKTSFFFCGR